MNFFYFLFVQKAFLTKKMFLFAEINLTTRGPLYTCLVLIEIDLAESVNLEQLQSTFPQLTPKTINLQVKVSWSINSRPGVIELLNCEI